MVRCPEQDCLLLQDGTAFAIFKHSSDDIASLISLVPKTDELRSLSCDTLRPEVLREAFGCKIDNGIRRVEDRLSGAIVTIEGDDLRCRTKAAGKVEDVANGCRTKRIDRLCIVADNDEPVTGRFESQQDR